MGNFRVRLSTFCIFCTFQSLYYKCPHFLLLHSDILFSISGGKNTKTPVLSVTASAILSMFHLFLYLVLSFKFSWKTKLFFLFALPHFYSHSLSLHFLSPHPFLLYFVFCLPEVMNGDFVKFFSLKTRVCQCFLPAKNSSLWTCLSLWMLHLLDLSLDPHTSKWGHRDLCWLCSWHRFKATSTVPAGCFTLQINLTTWGIIVRGRRAGTWTPSWAVQCLVIYHLNLSQLNNFSFNVIAFWRWEFPLSLRLSISIWQWLLSYNFVRSNHDSWLS